MVLTDGFLNEVAKAINNEGFVTPSDVAFSSTVITLDGAATSIPGELDRSSAVGSRSANEVTFNALRSGASVSPGGDFINTLGLFSSSVGGTLLAEALVPSVLHSSTFDFEVDWTVTIERK